MKILLICFISLSLNGFILCQSTLSFTDVSHLIGGNQGILTESCAWGDYDNDSDLDLYLTANGPNRLLRNNGNGTFTDVTAAAGVGNAGFGVGVGFADLDNDGYLDLYVVNFGSGPDVLYHNQGPDQNGVFQYRDITLAAGTLEESSSRGMAFIDFDRDGYIDIYVNAIGADILYKNLGCMVFENVASDMGIVNANGQGVGVVATDINNDGWVDLYNGNRSGQLSNLFINNLGNSFTDVAGQLGLTDTGLGMGVLAFDYDNDADIDLYWTTWPGNGEPTKNQLYTNMLMEQGTLAFTKSNDISGTADPLGWGISCNTGDLNNDMYEDFVITNGFSDASTANVIFMNEHNGTFVDSTNMIGGGLFDGRGVSLADYDADGDLDLLFTGDLDVGNRLYRNDSAPSNSITFRLTGKESNRSAIGSRITVQAGPTTMIKEVSGGAGRGSFNSLDLEFGLANHTQADRVMINWTNGSTTELFNVPTGIHDISESDCAIATNRINDKDISGDHSTLDHIVSSGCTQVNTTTSFTAPDHILLTKEFSVPLGSVFEANIGACQ